MQGLTLIVAAAASLLAFALPPVYGLVVYLASFAWYPTYLAVPVGTIDFTVRRIVILAIFANLYLRTTVPSRFKMILLDKLIIGFFVAQIASGIFTTPVMKLLENRAGEIFDVVLPYFAARMILTEKRHYLTFLKGAMLVAAPLAVVGFFQCWTGNNPVGFLRSYDAFRGPIGYSPIARAGFFRANVTFSHSIMYGLYFAMLGPLCAALPVSFRGARGKYYAGLALMALGVFASMSSGPVLAALLAVMFFCLYPLRRYWKPIATVIVLGCLCVEIISNRHFYDVLGDFTFSAQTAWYRSKLIDVALFQGGMSGHWIVGFGYGVDPRWCDKLDGRDHTDMVNHYLLVLCEFGLVAFVPFVLMNIEVAKNLVRAYRSCRFDEDRWLVWCLAGGLFGLLISLMSVSLFGAPTTIYYLMMAFSGALPAMMAKTSVVVRRRVAPAPDVAQVWANLPAPGSR
jgi:hypothetical protein